jgi:predicted transcriptional regulator
MSSAASSVRITSTANHRLNQLAEKLGQPKARVIEKALDILEERVFWREVQHAFAGTETGQSKAERELWDSTVNDGLAGDRW